MNTHTHTDENATQQESAPVKPAATPAGPARLTFGSFDPENENSEVESLMAEVQRNKVENGRVKALAAQLKAQEQELEKLRAERAALQANRSAVDYVDPELREIVDADILRANASMIKGSHDQLMDEVVKPLRDSLEFERNKRLRAETMSMDMRIEQQHPGFAADINTGGKHNEAWNAFLEDVDPRTGMKNGVLLVGAYNGGRDQGVNAMIDSFMDQSGISRWNGMVENAFPGRQAPYVAQQDAKADKTIYTMSQYQAELAASREAYSTGRQTAVQRSDLIAKLTRAAQEGRVMQDHTSPVGV